MPATVRGRSMAARRVDRFRCRHRGRIRQIRREHQNQRRDDAESEERVQRRQDGAQVSARTARKMPGCRGGNQAE